MLEKIKNNISFSNIVFIAICGIIAYYSSRYPDVSNTTIMLIAGIYILGRSFSVKKLDFDMTLLFLFTTFVIKAMLDQHTGKAWKVPTTLAMPVLMYLFGKLIATSKNIKTDFDSQIRIWIAVIAMAVGMLINNRDFLFNRIPASAVVIAAICGALDLLLTKIAAKNEKLLKLKWIPFAIVGVIALGKVAIWYHGDIRYIAFREALHLMITQHWGNFAFTVFPENTSSNMWLDYGRESGAMVMIPLAIFLVLSVVDSVKMALSRKIGLATKILLLVAFVLFNIYYFIDAVAFTYQYLWFFGLVINGMISAVKENN